MVGVAEDSCSRPSAADGGIACIGGASESATAPTTAAADIRKDLSPAKAMTTSFEERWGLHVCKYRRRHPPMSSSVRSMSNRNMLAVDRISASFVSERDAGITALTPSPSG